MRNKKAYLIGTGFFVLTGLAWQLGIKDLVAQINFHELGSYSANFVQTHTSTILAYLAAGGGISVALQFIKKLRSWDNGTWIQFILGVFSTLTAAADYYINNYENSPATRILGDLAPKLFVAAIIMHRIAVNPLTKILQKNLGGFFAGFKSGVQSYKQDADKPVTAPPVQPQPEQFV